MKPRFHDEDEMEFNPDEFDATPASKFDFGGDFEPIEKEEESNYGSDEAELKALQAKLRDLPKGHPMKKELAVRILDLHKKLSSEDTGYSQRREKAASKIAAKKRREQEWKEDILADTEDPFESRRVLRCSDFIILEKKRAEVLKDADAKYPNLSKPKMKEMLKDQEKGAKDFKTKAKKYFNWAKDPEAAAAAFIRKATGKEPKDL